MAKEKPATTEAEAFGPLSKVSADRITKAAASSEAGVRRSKRLRRPTDRYGTKSRDSTPIDEMVDSVDDIEKGSIKCCPCPYLGGLFHQCMYRDHPTNAGPKHYTRKHPIIGYYSVPKPKTHRSIKQWKTYFNVPGRVDQEYLDQWQTRKHDRLFRRHLYRNEVIYHVRWEVLSREESSGDLPAGVIIRYLGKELKRLRMPTTEAEAREFGMIEEET